MPYPQQRHGKIFASYFLNKLFLFITIAFGSAVCTSSVVWAETVDLLVTADQAPVVVSPDDTNPAGHVKKGRIVRSDGTIKNGHYRLLTKGEKIYWIRTDHVKAKTPAKVEEELLGMEERPSGNDHFPKFTFDLGFSSGNYNDYVYSEANLGLNTYFNSWFNWRNAAFAQFVPEHKNVYGLDTSARPSANFGGRPLLIHTFAGLGYRFVSEGNNVPFVEAGAVLTIFGLHIGGGAKILGYSLVDNRYENSTQYFIVLSGGGAL